MKESIQSGSQRMDFTLNSSARKTLGIKVTPELEVIVNEPDETTLSVLCHKNRREMVRYKGRIIEVALKINQ
jgi:hypothetical protein